MIWIISFMENLAEKLIVGSQGLKNLGMSLCTGTDMGWSPAYYDEVWNYFKIHVRF